MASFADDLAAALVANQALIKRLTALVEARRRMGKCIAPETLEVVAQYHERLVQLRTALMD